MIKHDVDLYNAKSLFEMYRNTVFEVQGAYRLSLIACMGLVLMYSWHWIYNKVGQYCYYEEFLFNF